MSEETKEQEVNVDETADKEAVSLSEEFDKKIDETDVDGDDLHDEDIADDDNSSEEEVSEDDTADTTEQETETEDKSEEETATEDDGISEEQIRRAVNLGMTRYDALSFGDTKTLDKALSFYESKLSEQPEAKAEPELKQKETKDAEFDITKYFDPDVVAPEVLDGLKAMAKDQNEVIQSLKAELVRTRESSQRELEQQWARELDGMCESLGDDFKDVFGEGPGNKLSPDSQALANRIALDEKITILAKGYEAVGKPMPSGKELFDEAIGLLYRDKLVSQKTKKLGTKVKKRESQILNRANQGGSKPLTDLEKAVKLQTDFDKRIDEA